MTEFLSTTVAFIVILGILVFFHEFGHFTAAKSLGMKVEEFAFGFGPRLVRLWKRKETEYTIRAIPLGGFVKLPGMEPGDEQTPDGFNSQAVWKRALVIFSGPFASFLLGFLVFCIIGVTIGFPKEKAKAMPVVDMINPGWPADKVGLKGGDRILQIDSTKITSGEQVLTIVHASPNKPLKLVVRRGDKIFTVTATPQPQTMIGEVAKDSTAARAGLKLGDQITEINGKKVGSGTEVLKLAGSIDKNKVPVKVARANKIVTLQVPPEALKSVMGLLGFTPKMPMEKTGIIESIRNGTYMTINYVKAVAATFTSRQIKNVGGIVAIARVTDQAVQSGFGALLLETGMLSLGLAVVNLFPLPILDGGHLFFLFLEWIRGGRKLTAEQMAAVNSIGLAAIIFLAVLLFYMDIVRWISGTPLQ